MKYLLKEIHLLQYKYSVLKQKNNFNIFETLYKIHDEKKLHSRFLACLLSPFEYHDYGNIFLKSFLNQLDISFDIDDNNLEVYPYKNNKIEYKNIDILIINRKSMQAIIIENKIYARDSNQESGGQLERYFELIRDEDKIPKNNIITLYLTLDGHEPSLESLGKFKVFEKMNGICIDYVTNIIPWLNECLSNVSEDPFLRESIIQYRRIINKMTNNEFNNEKMNEVIDIISENSENLESTKFLYDNFKHIKFNTVNNFFDKLKINLGTKYKIINSPTEQNLVDLTYYELYRKGQRAKQEFNFEFEILSGIKIIIPNDPDEWLYYRINFSDKLDTQLFEDNFSEFDIESDSIISKYFFDSDEKGICLSDFSYPGTFNLINKNYQDMIINEITEEIHNSVNIINNLIKSKKIDI